mmetsp:Transcript_3085/g.2065  ORF Transcript_3085/g.2065 Transcript_3085/m.2065 type:complete len:265 (+) Transcript_3085:38-832(+)
MGGSVAKPAIPVQTPAGRSINEEELCKVLMPIYYTSEPITVVEQEKAVRAWKVIASGQAAEFYRLKKADPVNVTCQTPMEFFGNRLVKRFIEVHPVVKHMFNKNTLKQGTLFFRMIAFTISALDDESKFDSQFVTLAKTHNRMGIRAVEYGVFGECLFWVLRLTLGAEIYDAQTNLGWVKIYSRILGVIIPIAVRYELDNKSAIQEKSTKRFQNMTSERWLNGSASAENSAHHQASAPSSIRQAAVAENTAELSTSRMISVMPN